jgi:hypothetical protein
VLYLLYKRNLLEDLHGHVVRVVALKSESLKLEELQSLVKRLQLLMKKRWWKKKKTNYLYKQMHPLQMPKKIDQQPKQR